MKATVGDEHHRERGAFSVDRAADQPRLIDLTSTPPQITVAGKGVTFDMAALLTRRGMRQWKKTWRRYGCHGVELPQYGLGTQQPRMLLPVAENAIAGNAFRPGDILHIL